MATLSPSAMSSMQFLSGSFAMQGLARATAVQTKGASAAVTTVSHASGSMHRLFVTLLSLPVTARCYSGAVFVPGTESYPEYSLKDYDVDALLASQQRPLAAVVLFKTFWKYYLLHEALHANTYFSEIDRLEQEEFERGGGPLQNWPPYYSGGAREWWAMLATVSRATGRETAVKLVRLGLARFSCSVCDDLSAQRSAFKLLKDAGKSAATKRDLARETSDSLVAAAASSSSPSLFERLAARSAARLQRGPALAAAAGATAFRSGLLFSLSDFIVSAATEMAWALFDAAREARGEREEGRGRPATAAARRGDHGSSSGPCSGALAALASLSDYVSALFVGRGITATATAAVLPASAALAGILRSSAVAFAYAAAIPSLVRGGAAGGGTTASPYSSEFFLAGVAAGSLALVASTRALRAALGEQRAAMLAAAVSRAAVRCAVGLSVTSVAYGCAAVLLPSWTWPGVQLAADNAAHMLLVGPAMQEPAELGGVGRGRAVALSAALAAGCVAVVGVF